MENEEQIQIIFHDESIVKLFYQNHRGYSCYSQNWGKSKGQDHYNDVCVVLNQTAMMAYKSGSLDNLAPSSRNKLYVACTRANRNLYFIEESRVERLQN